MRVWDLPLRLFHWALLICVVGAVGSAKAGAMNVHERFGLTIMALVAFRIIWGFIGGHHARFANFVSGPRRLLGWFTATRTASGKNSDPRPAGHSPLAALSVIALLTIAGMMSITGSVSTDGILFDGPLAHLVPELSKDATKLHHRLKILLIALIAMHILAIIIYKIVKHVPLTKAMITGRATDVVSGSDGGISGRHTALGLGLMLALIAGAHLLPSLRPSLF